MPSRLEFMQNEIVINLEPTKTMAPLD